MAQLPATVRFVNTSPQVRSIIGTTVIPLEEGELSSMQEELEVDNGGVISKVQWFPGGWSQARPDLYPGGKYDDGSYRSVVVQMPVEMVGEAGGGEGITEIVVSKGSGPVTPRADFEVDADVLTGLANMDFGVTFDGVTRTIPTNFASLRLVEGALTNGNNRAENDHVRRYESFVRLPAPIKDGIYFRLTLELYHQKKHCKFFLEVGNAIIDVADNRTRNPHYRIAPGEGCFILINSTDLTGAALRMETKCTLETQITPNNWSWRMIDPAFRADQSTTNRIPAGMVPVDVMGVMTFDASQTSVSELLNDESYGIALNWTNNPSGAVNEGLLPPFGPVPPSPYATVTQERSELESLVTAILAELPDRSPNFRLHPFGGFAGTSGQAEQKFAFNAMPPSLWMLTRSAWPRMIEALLLGVRQWTKKTVTFVYPDGSPFLSRNHPRVLWFSGIFWDTDGLDQMGYTVGQYTQNENRWRAVPFGGNEYFAGPDRSHMSTHYLVAAAMVTGDYRARKIVEQTNEMWIADHNPAHDISRGKGSSRGLGRGQMCGAYLYSWLGSVDMAAQQDARMARFRGIGTTRDGDFLHGKDSRPGYPHYATITEGARRDHIEKVSSTQWMEYWAAMGLYAWSQVAPIGEQRERARYMAYEVAKTCVLFGGTYIGGYDSPIELLLLRSNPSITWTGTSPWYDDARFRIQGQSSGANIQVVTAFREPVSNRFDVWCDLRTWNGIKFTDGEIVENVTAGHRAVGATLTLGTPAVHLVECVQDIEGIQTSGAFGDWALKPMPRSWRLQLATDLGVNDPYSQGSPFSRIRTNQTWRTDTMMAAAVVERMATEIGEPHIALIARRVIESIVGSSKSSFDAAVGSQWGGTVGWGGRYPYAATAMLEAPYQASDPLVGSRIGLNLDNILNYSEESSRLFTNNMMFSDRLVEVTAGTGTKTGAELDGIRSDGFPTSIRPGTDAICGLFTGIGYDGGSETYRQGTYYFSCLGSGRIRTQGAAVSNTGDFVGGIFLHPIVVTAPNPSGEILFVMEATNTDAGSGPIRSWSLVHEDDLADFVAGRTFQTQALTRYSPPGETGIECYRFMNWARTTGDDDWKSRNSDDDFFGSLNPIEDWSDEKTVLHQTMCGGATELVPTYRVDASMPIQLMVEWCNLHKADMWISLPPKVSIDDNFLPFGERSTDSSAVPWDGQKAGWGLPRTPGDGYVNNALTYIRDNLNPTLKVHIELDNEQWNGSFAGHYYWSRETGPTGGLAQARNIAPGDDEFTRGRKAYGVRSREVFYCAREVFGNELHRIECQVGGRFVGNYDETEPVLGIGWMPAGKETWRVTNAIALNYYYGNLGNAGLEGKTPTEILTELDQALFDPGDRSITSLIDPVGTNPARSFKPWIDRFGSKLNHPTVGEPLNLLLTGYEGGSHMSYGGGVQQTIDNIKTALRSTGPGLTMEALQTKLYEGFHALEGLGVCCEFLSMYAYGSNPGILNFFWGVFEHPAQSDKANRPARAIGIFDHLQTHNRSSGGGDDPPGVPDRFFLAERAPDQMFFDTIVISGDVLGVVPLADRFFLADAPVTPAEFLPGLIIRQLGIGPPNADKGGSTAAAGAGPAAASAPPPKRPPGLTSEGKSTALYSSPSKPGPLPHNQPTRPPRKK